MEDITIPKGYEARIEGDKVVFVEKESEDERIRERIIQYLISIKRGSVICTIDTSEEIAWLKRQKAAEWLAHFDKQKEHKPAGQDYSGLSEFERAIHRGFLCAGVENVPVNIIKDTAAECLGELNSSRWSEEDKGLIDLAVAAVEDFYDGKNPIRVEIINFLKSLPERFK